MNVIVAIILLILVFLYVFIKLFFGFIINTIKMLIGWKKYEFTKILSYGMKTDHKWFRTDKQALNYGKNYEFIDIVQPVKKRLKPNS